MKRPALLYPLLFLHLLFGFGALYGGVMLVADPVGFGMNPHWLDGSPFRSYFIPGLYLFVVNGLFPLIIFWGLVTKTRKRGLQFLNIYDNRHWAWTCSLYSGILLIGWINVQILFVPFFYLQPVFLAVGLLIVILTLMPGVMTYFERSE